MSLLIRNTLVLDPAPEGVRVLEGHDVLVEGRTIAAVTPTGTLQADTVLDGTEHLTLPGLINTHAHTAMVLFRGVAEDVTVESWFNDIIWAMETNLNAEDVYWGAMLGIIEMLESGVTTVADHYFSMERIAQAVAESGMRAHLAPTLFGQDDGSALKESRAFAETWHESHEGRIRVWLGPHSPYLCPEDFLKEVAQEAKASGLGVHLHVSETPQQVAASQQKHGLTPPAYLESLCFMDVPLLCAHAANATPEDVQLLGRYGVGVSHCPKTFLKLASGIAPVVDMRRAGVRVGLGTDGAASNNTLDILEQMRLTPMLQKHEREDATVLDRFEALSMATYEGARVLRQEHELGRVAPGYLADLITVRLDGAHLQPVHDPVAALVYSARASDVASVIVNGQLLMRERQLLTIDKREVYKQVHSRLHRIIGRDHGRRLQSFPG